MARPRRLRWVGAVGPDGRPERWFAAVPARGLDADDIARLGPAVVAEITGGAEPLYVADDGEEPEPAAKAGKAKA